MRQKYWPLFLLVVYLVWFTYGVINRYHFNDWAEANFVGGATVLIFVILYLFKIRFSSIAYTLALFFPMISILSGYLGYGDSSYNIFNNSMSFGSDVFEKLSHFAFGFYAYPITELLLKSNKIGNKYLTIFFVVAIISFITMDYEVIEIFGSIKSGELDPTTVFGSKYGILYVQKDIFMGALGAVLSSVVYLFFGKDKINN